MVPLPPRQLHHVIKDLGLHRPVRVVVALGQNGCSQDDAFGILQRASSSRNLKLREVATHLLETATSESVPTHFEC